jgi:hypothetical protein
LPLELARFAAFGFVSKIFFMVELLFAGRKNKIRRAVHAFQNPVLKFWHGTILREGKAARLPFAPPVGTTDYSISRRLFFRFRLRAKACFTRNFSPGFR